MDEHANDRRRFLLAAAAMAGAAILPTTGLAQDFWSAPRTLWLVRKQTGEQIRELYWHNGTVVKSGYDSICHLLRDVQANVTIPMNLVLLDVLRGIQGWFEAYGQPRPIIVNSGHRTAGTNANTEGAAKNSLHLTGHASDIWVPDVPAWYLAELGAYLAGGGVGFYPSKGFIHVDSGRLRFWRG